MPNLTHRDKCAATKDCRFWWCVEKDHCFGSPRAEIAISKEVPPINLLTRKRANRKKLISLREQIIAKTNGHCWLCETPLKDDFTVDHKRPLARGGTNGMENLFPAHKYCNFLKGTKLIKSAEEFKKLFPDIIQSIKPTPK